MGILREVLESSREEDTDRYLTDHPKLLLAAFGHPWAVNECLSKFRFGNEFVSDFVVVTGQSFHYDVTLVELEPPTARPFTRDGKYAARLNDALGQVNDWLSWIRENRQYFRQSLANGLRSMYGSRQLLRPYDDREPLEMIGAKVIIGRRTMLSPDDDRRRASIFEQSTGRLEILPYDRLVDIEENIQAGDDRTGA